MAKDPRFNFYPDNWAGGTRRMTFEQKGAYMELIMLNFYCFSDGLAGFTEAEALHALAHATAPAELWNFLRAKFETDGKIFWSARMKKEFEKSQAYSKKQSDRAKKKWDKATEQPTASAVADAYNGTGIGTGNKTAFEKKEGCGEKTKVPRGTTHDFTQPDIEGDTLLFPLDTKPMRELWTHWKKYRWEKYQARYGFMGEQADLKRLERMTFDQIQSTILAAISNGWKNLYPEQNRNQGNGKSNKKQQHMDQVKQSVASHYESVFAKGGGKPDG